MTHLLFANRLCISCECCRKSGVIEGERFTLPAPRCAIIRLKCAPIRGEARAVRLCRRNQLINLIFLPSKDWFLAS